MAQEKKSPKQLAEELATDAENDPRFRGRTPGVRATRHISREQADNDIAGQPPEIGTSGGGGPGGTAGQQPTGETPVDELDDTTLGIGPSEQED